LDGELVHGLQRVSSRGASALLDLASIRHLMSGNVLELSSKNFFVEEACSGIGSVFLLLASVAVYASWRQLRLVVTIPLLVSSVFWAVAGNTFRIFSVAWAHENLQLDLSSGSQHDLLGTGTYLMSLVLLFMTEQALLFLFEPIGPTVSPKASDTKTQTLAVTMSLLWDDLTTMDSEVRMERLLSRHVSGFRVTYDRFIALLILFFCLGCAGNIGSCWPTIMASVQEYPAALGVTESKPMPVVSPVPSSVLSPFYRLTPNTLARISGLSVVSPAAAVTTLTDQAAPANGVQSAETAASDYPQRLEMKANGLVAGEKDSGIHRLEWALEFAETPVLLIINGPHRVDDARLLTSRKIGDHGEVDKWITTESASVPLADVANDLPVLLDQTLKNSSGQFRHELTAEFTQVASLMPMDELGSLSAMQRQFSPGISGEDTDKGQWYWRFTLRFESDRPVPSAVRPSRLAVFESILKALLEHWRTEA
jgi:exosortase/archaeosortase family protein